jgi:phosphatidate cytidylyltransferase
MLSTRLIIGFSMVGLVLLVLCLDEWLAPWFPIWFLFSGAVMAASALELVELMKGTSVRPSGSIVLGGVMAILVANWMPHLVSRYHPHTWPMADPTFDPAAPVAVLAWPFLTFVAVVMGTFLVQSVQFQKPGETLATIAGTVLAVAYVGLLSSFIIQIRWFDGRFHGLVPLVYLIATAKMTDTGAYTLGRLAGRHKLWPRLSPNKTVEGAFGGIVFSVGAALIVEVIVRYLLHAVGLGWERACGFGLVVGAAAQLGDLMESMIKRDCLRKDASGAVPGFGGVLDVLDSLLFAGPVAYAYWLTFGP